MRRPGAPRRRARSSVEIRAAEWTGIAVSPFGSPQTSLYRRPLRSWREERYSVFCGSGGTAIGCDGDGAGAACAAGSLSAGIDRDGVGALEATLFLVVLWGLA